MAWAFCACARATSTCACATFDDSPSEAVRALAVSSSAEEMKFCATRSCLRFSSRCASPRSPCARVTCASALCTLACAVSTEARAASTSAVDWRTRYSKVSGSSRAISWPSLTSLLKSTNSSLIWPDTCELICTWRTGVTVPVADTAACSGPRSILPVRKLSGGSGTRTRNHQPRPPMRARSSAAPTQRDVFMARILGTPPVPARRTALRFAILYRRGGRPGAVPWQKLALQTASGYTTDRRVI